MSTSLRESGVTADGAGGGCRTIWGCGVELLFTDDTSATLLGGGSSLSNDMMLTLRSGARAGAGAGCCWDGGSGEIIEAGGAETGIPPYCSCMDTGVCLDMPGMALSVGANWDG